VRILIVEDSVKLARLLGRALAEERFAADLIHTGEEGCWLAEETAYDAIVLDIGLGDIDGFEVCRRLRSAGRWTPILMLTARDAIEDRIQGLDAGADDYLIKPFAIGELVARLRALLRRGAPARPTLVTVGDLTLDPATGDVRRGAHAIELSAKEYSVLECFMRHQGQILSRQDVLDHVWDFAFEGDPHIVTVYVGSLRDKIDRPFGRASLETVRARGYRLRDDRPPTPTD
jgi:two-component system, OmpR family, response regulator